MRWRRVALALVVLVAAGAVGVGAFIALWSDPRPANGAGLAGLFGVVLGVVALLAVAVRSRLGSDPDREAAPWTDEGAVVEQPPESTPDDVAVSGTALAERVDAATSAARSAGDFRAGVERARPPLRETLAAALVASGRDREAVERALAEGDWTDDRLAAAVLDEAVAEPERSFLQRLRDWLFPERAVRRRVNRAVAAVDEAADAALPPVVGADAPRTVPVVAPTLDDLQRTADGRLQRAEAVGDGGWGRRESRRNGDGASRDGADGTPPAKADTNAGGEAAGAGPNGAGETAEDSGPSEGTEPATETATGSDWNDVAGGAR